MKTVIIAVLARDIAKARQLKRNKHSFESALQCPVALALQRRTGNQTVRAGVRKVWENDNYDRAFIAKMPARFIEDFDAGKPVKPFRFALDRAVFTELSRRAESEQ